MTDYNIFSEDVLIKCLYYKILIGFNYQIKGALILFLKHKGYNLKLP
jgi:hypothetical protein